MSTALNRALFYRDSIINPFSLKFYSGEVEDAFYRESTIKSIKLIRLTLIIGTLIYASFSTLDNMIVPNSATKIMIIRSIVCLFLFGGFLYTFFQSYQNNIHLVNGSMIIIAGLGIIAMIISTNTDEGYYYYAGLLIIIFWAHTLIRTRFIYATLESLILFAIYISVSLWIKPTSTPILMNNLYFLAAANLAGMFASYIIELCLKNEFWKTILLNEKKTEIEKENERKNKELNDARKLQLSLLPAKLPQHPLIEMAVSIETATEVGGDYYDFHLSEEGTLTMAIGDATGHGVKAGILVTAAKIIFSNLASKDMLVNMLDKASGIFSKLGESNLFMAMALGRLQGKNLELAGAGMPPALRYSPSNGKLEQISLNGLPLGSPVSLPFDSRNITLDEGDVVMLMSDGFPEMFDKNGNMLGYEQTLNIFKETADKSPEEIIKHFKNKADIWLNGEHLQDDMTFIVMKMKTDVLNMNFNYN